MSGEPAKCEIPAEIEAEVLAILDSTEPGTDRDVALAALGLDPKVRDEVDNWLSGADESTFLGSPADGAPEQSDTGAIPRRMGNYELQEVLGKGGMGIVYRAQDLRLGRTVALKALPEHFADNPKRLQRFEREVRAVAQLRHPHIVPVFEAGKIGDVPYFTMELVTGCSLDRAVLALREHSGSVGALRPRDWQAAIGGSVGGSSGDHRDTYLATVCRLIIEIAEALQHAHDKAIIHRDVKPSNIMARGDGPAMLFDFGLARFGDSAAMTRTSELIGSPHYMSPEQIAGKDIDHRTDIYSLGVTMYELLTLTVPFEGNAPQQIYQLITDREPQRPGLINPHLPKDVETICVTAMEKRADRRYQTATDMAADLQRFLRFEPIHARPIGPVTRSARWLRRNRVPVVIVLLLAVAAIALYESSGDKERAAKSEGEVVKVRKELDELRTEKGKVISDLDALQKRADAAQTDLDGAGRRLAHATRELATAQRKGERLRKENKRQSEELRGARAAARSLGEQRTGLQREIKAERANLKRVRADFDNAQRNLARAEHDREEAITKLKKAEADYGKLAISHRITTINRLLMEALMRRSDNPGLGLMLAREAAELAALPGTGTDRALQTRVVDALLELLRKNQEQRTFTGHSHPVTAIDFSPGGEHLVSTSSHGFARVWSRATGRTLATLPGDSSLVHVEYVGKDSVLLAQESGAMMFWNCRSAADSQPIAMARHSVRVRRHLGPGGRWFVAHVDSAPGPLRRWRKGEPASGQLVGGTKDRFSSFEFGPDGDRIVAITPDDEVQIWNLRKPELIARHRAEAAVISACFDREGRRIAILDARGTVAVLAAADANELTRWRIGGGQPLGTGRISFCAENTRLLVSATGAEHHFLFDPRTGAERAKIPATGTARGFFLDDKRRLLACLPVAANAFVLIDTRNGTTVTHFHGHADSGTSPHRPMAVFSPDGTSVATVYGDTTARVWKAGPGGALTAFGPDLAGADGDVTGERLLAARFEPAGLRVISASDRGLTMWRVRDGGRLAHVRQSVARPLISQSFTDDGTAAVCFDAGRVTRIAAGKPPSVVVDLSAEHVHQVTCWPGDRTAVLLWGGPTHGTRQLLFVDASGRRRESVDLPPGRLGGGMAYPSPDGSRFAIGYDELTVIATAEPARRFVLPSSRPPMAFSTDSQWIAASTGYSIKVWNATSGAERCELGDLPRGYSPLTDLVFSPGGKRVATAWSDGVILVHDATTGRREHMIEAHRLRIGSLCFGADGKLLLSSSDDTTARMWHVDSGSPHLTFSPGEECVYAEFNHDGTEVLVVCPGRMHVFPLALPERAAEACPRRLTEVERREFGLGQ